MPRLACVVSLILAIAFSTKAFTFNDHPSRSKILSATGTESDSTTMPEVKAGDKVPSVVLTEGLGGFETQEVNLAELIAGKKVAIFGVPGAFTPGTYPVGTGERGERDLEDSHIIHFCHFSQAARSRICLLSWTLKTI